MRMPRRAFNLVPRVAITDVTLRDGLQQDPRILSVAEKIALFRELESCGYDRLEITSFIAPGILPQFNNSEDFCQALFANADATVRKDLMAFIPNQRGFARFVQYPIGWASAFVASTESFNQANVRRSIDETLTFLAQLIPQAHALDRHVRVYLSTAFGCPFEGTLPLTKLIPVLEKVIALNPDEIAISDTIGVAKPEQVTEMLTWLRGKFPFEKIAFHFHDTHGHAISCAQAALAMGVRKFDGSKGGVGGCPFAPGSKGNVATEDLVKAFKNHLTHTSAVKTPNDSANAQSPAAIAANVDAEPLEIWRVSQLC